MNLHKSIHGGALPTASVLLGRDGVQECNKTSTSLDVIGLTFTGCHKVYPISVYKVCSPEEQPDEESNILRDIVQELKWVDFKELKVCTDNFLSNSENGCRVLLEVADAPQRAKDLRLAGHQAYYGCDLCTSKADKLTLDGRVIASKRVWRPVTANGPRRSKEQTLKLAKATLQDEIGRLPHMNFGVKGLPWAWALPVELEPKSLVFIAFIGRSHLFDLNQFDPMKQVLPEAMHMAFLGIVKLLTILTFGLGKARISANPNPRIKPNILSDSLINIKVPSEVCKQIVIMFFSVISEWFLHTFIVQQCYKTNRDRIQGRRVEELDFVLLPGGYWLFPRKLEAREDYLGNDRIPFESSVTPSKWIQFHPRRLCSRDAVQMVPTVGAYLWRL